MASKIYYGVMTEVRGDDTGKAEIIYSSARDKKPEDTEESRLGTTLIKEWYGSQRLAERALVMRKETLRKLATA